MNVKDYEIINFKKSPIKNKKYRVELQNNKNDKIKHIDFGQLGYEHYYDSTPLQLYKKNNHYDEQRLINFRNRFRSKYNPKKLTPLWFSWNYLWV